MKDRLEVRETDAREAAEEAAAQAGLVYVSDRDPGVVRRKIGARFAYFDPDGKPVRDEGTLRRIASLAIPPAYGQVWICPDPNGHIQATGRDARGRKQYRYHPQWIRARDQTKYEHVLEFARALPALRERVAADMARRGLTRERVLATLVHLLDATLIRVGNEDYAKSNKSYGLTTLRNQHVEADGQELRFRFKGKSGKTWSVRLRDRRVARVIRGCQELPGQHLFEYVDADGAVRSVGSADVNAYLREATGRDVTAKDFRTWRGTVLAALALAEFESFENQAHAKKQIRTAIERVAQRLGNTMTICRKCYVHPGILESYLDGRLAQEIGRRAEKTLEKGAEGLAPEEVAVIALLSRRLRLGGTGERSRRRRAVAPPQRRSRKAAVIPSRAAV